MATNNPFLTLKKKVDNALRKLPRKVGVLAVNHFQDNFKRQGFDGKPWKEVKRRLPIGGRTGRRSTRLRYQKGAARTRGILIGTGRLRRDIRLISASSTKVVVGTGLVYAPVHDLGLRAGRGSGFVMPQRKFMGTDKKLVKDIQALIEKDIAAAFK
jgi:phage virion morphogenesis protein